MRSGPALHPGVAVEAEAMEYDVIVIGAGQAGGPLAGAFAKAGRRTALIEREHVGGTCINEGCTPTKTMVASARVAHLVRRAADYGVDVPAPVVDMVRVRERKRDIVRSFRGGSERRLESAGVDLIAGEARFVGGKTLSVNGRNGEHTLDAPCIVINTGARPARPRASTPNRARRERPRPVRHHPVAVPGVHQREPGLAEGVLREDPGVACELRTRVVDLPHRLDGCDPEEGGGERVRCRDVENPFEGSTGDEGGPGRHALHQRVEPGLLRAGGSRVRRGALH